MLSYPFLARAMLVGVLVSLCAALLGTSLVLKRYSMIGDGLSHVGFGALAIASALGWVPLAVAVPVVVIAAVALLRVSQTRSAIKGDAAVALISSGALAVGVLVISLTSGSNTNVSNYMFGSILTVSRADAWLSVALCAAVLACCTLFYPRFFAVTFDETFMRATGGRAGRYNLLLAVLTAVTVVLGMRMMGALLISSLIIFPPLAAMRVFRTFKSVTVCSAVLGTILGMIAGYLGGAADAIIMRMCDVFLSIPNLILSIAIIAVLGTSTTNLIIVLIISSWVQYCKLSRNNVLVTKKMEFVSASKCLGATNSHIIFKEIFPNITTQLIILVSQQFGNVILVEAALSFMNLGISPPTPSWGNMIAGGRTYLTTYPWLCVVPGMALMITVLAFNFLGDGVRDVLDPKRT